MADTTAGGNGSLGKWINSGWTRTAIQLLALGAGGFYALGQFKEAVSTEIGKIQTQIAADYRELDGRVDRVEAWKDTLTAPVRR